MEIQSNYDELTDKIAKTTQKIAVISENVHESTTVIGFTGAGKSTLVSSMLKAPLKHKKKQRGGTYIIDHNDQTGKYPKIGHDNISCTEIPDIFQVNNQCFADLTGFVQTRGLDQQIINGFSNSCMFQKGKRVKIMIVFDIACLNVTRGDPVVTIAQRMFDLFQQDFELVINSTMLVMSKVNTDDYDEQYIGEVITDITRQNKNLTPSTIRLLDTIVRNKRIAIFPNPDKIQNHVELIQNKLKLLNFTTLRSNGKVSLSPEAVNKINQYIYTLVTNLRKAGQNIAKSIKSQFTQKQYQNGQTINQDLCILKKVKVMLETQTKRLTLYTQGIELMKELTTSLKLSDHLTGQVLKIFTMIQFYRCLNSQIDVSSNFIQIICMSNNQAIGILSVQLQKFTSAQERSKMQAIHKNQMQQRQTELNQKLEKAQKDMKDHMAKSTLEIDQQNKKFTEMIKQKDQRYQQYHENMQRQLAQLRNQKQEVIYVESKKSGGFFGGLTSFIGGLTGLATGIGGLGTATKGMMGAFKF